VEYLQDPEFDSFLSIGNQVDYNLRCTKQETTMKKLLMLLIPGFVFLALFLCASQQNVLAQQPTVSIPTVTGTSTGPMITVPQDQVFINVRSGPSQDFPLIGILVTGEKTPALGISGDYVEIVYMGVPGNVGWVHRSLIILKNELPQVTPPPTPTQRVTPTLDPTLAAKYVVEKPPTSLPTYTRPAPLVLPTYAQSDSTLMGGSLPAGFLIIGLAVVGFFGIVITLLRGR
jgi:hypothetical protein